MKEIVSAIMANIIKDTDVEIVEIQFVTGGRRPLVKVFVDKKGGINVSECGKIARELSVHCQVEEKLPEDLIFEVSSPGLDRLFKTTRDFERNIGRLVELYVKIDEKERRFEGILESATDQVVTVVSGEQKNTFERSRIVRAKQHIKF